MCKLKSAIIMKDNIFIPDYNSHTDMLSELGIADNEKNANTIFVRAELYPADGDMFTPITDWFFDTDQDILPKWFVKDYEKTRMCKAVEKWAELHIYKNICGLELSHGGEYYLKNCTDVVLKGNVQIAQLHDSTIDKVCENAKINQMKGTSVIKEMSDNSNVDTMFQSSLIKNMKDKAIVNMMWDNAKIETMMDKTLVNEMHDNSLINEMQNKATIGKMWDNSTINEMNGKATVNEMRGKSNVNKTNKSKFNLFSLQIKPKTSEQIIYY